MIKNILWDIDGTLLNFKIAERKAIDYCFEKFGLGICDDEMLKDYSRINHKYWGDLEKGLCTREEVLINRFHDFFSLYGFDTSICDDFNREYQLALGETCVYCDDSLEIVKKFKEDGYKQYVITNGSKLAQDKKLVKSGFGKLMDGIYISENLGYEKPSIKFFEVLNNDGINFNDSIIIGDSLTSDIKGGNNAGILTCWYNPNHMLNNGEATANYEIDNLSDVEKIIMSI